MRIFKKIGDILTFGPARRKVQKRKAEIAERAEKAKKQEEIRLYMENLKRSIISDWKANKSRDKFKMEKPYINYRMDNGTRIKYSFGEGVIEINEKTQIIRLSMGLSPNIEMMTIMCNILESIDRGEAGSAKPEDVKKRQRYQTMLENVTLRKEGLSKMSKNDPNRPGMEAELKIAEKMLIKLKSEL